jgi:hypothetical protein
MLAVRSYRQPSTFQVRVGEWFGQWHISGSRRRGFCGSVQGAGLTIKTCENDFALEIEMLRLKPFVPNDALFRWPQGSRLRLQRVGFPRQPFAF